MEDDSYLLINGKKQINQDISSTWNNHCLYLSYQDLSALGTKLIPSQIPQFSTWVTHL